MAGNDWNNLGREVKDIVQHAIDTGDFGALNRDLGGRALRTGERL